jgi:hypothetical protein
MAALIQIIDSGDLCPETAAAANQSPCSDAAGAVSKEATVGPVHQ